MGSASNIGEFATAVCLQSDGRILASGYTRHGLLMDHGEIAIARYHANGVLDSSFGINGKVTTSLPVAYADRSKSAVINHNNELVVAGTDGSPGGLTKWMLVGYDLGPMLLGVPNTERESQITIAPNPTEDFTRIYATHLENGTWHLSVSDLTGKVLYSEKELVTNNALDKSISLAGLPAATYLVKVDNGKRRMTVKVTKGS